MHRGILLIVLALAAALAGAPAASALPATPWTGRWLDNNGSVLTLTQNGSQISGTQPCPGTTTLPGVNFNGTASPDNRTATFTYTSSVCTGTGGTFSGTMSDDGLRVTGTGVTQFGTGFGFSWAYQSGGTEPRTSPPTTTTPGAREQCPGGIWSGRWSARGSAVFTYVQSGSTLTGTLTGRADVIRGTISGNTVRGTFTIEGEQGTFLLTMAPDGRSYTYAGTTTTGATDEPFTSQFLGCAAATGPVAPPGPDLQRTIPNPQTVTNGPTSLVAPGTISLRSLRRSKCVLVKAASRRPARVLVSIFSGRRSIRLFGQKLVIFVVPGSRQVCIPVPFRAHTFNVRTPLRVALGYTAGPRRQRTGRKPPPVIRPIKLVP